MPQKTRTYRLFCLLLATLVLLGSALPTGLHGKSMIMKLCDLSGDTHPAAQCDRSHFHGNQHKPSGESACELNVSCDCQIDRPPVQPETTLFSKAPSDIFLRVISHVAMEDISISNNLSAGNDLHRLTDSSPPLFLKNESFLN